MEGVSQIRTPYIDEDWQRTNDKWKWPAIKETMNDSAIRRALEHSNRNTNITVEQER
jgi:hypothetical protein